MAHVYTETDAMSVPAYVAGQGKWTNFNVADDGEARTAAATGVSIEALADRTVWLRHKDAVVEPFGVTIPSLAANGATVAASNSYVMTKASTITATVPNGGAGYTHSVIWTTPMVPFSIDMAFIRLTGASTASAPPIFVALDLNLNSKKLVGGNLSPYEAGFIDPLVVMRINTSTLNKSIIGIAASDRGPLLDGTLTNGGKDSVGAASVAGSLVCYDAFGVRPGKAGPKGMGTAMNS